MGKQGRNQQLYDGMNIVLIMDTGNVHWKLLAQYCFEFVCFKFLGKKMLISI